MLHFVGMRGDDYTNAVKVFGHPDFIHVTHDHRMYGDVDVNNDTIIFGKKSDPDQICPYSDQDHARY